MYSTCAPRSNEWTRSPAEFDFRSDTVTSPTPSMLAALSNASLGDDVYQESTTTNALSTRIAKLFGKEVALFVLSGTMGNQLCIRALLEQPPYSVLCDHRAHICTSEAGATALISQATITPVIPRNGLYLTLEDVKKHVIISDDIHYAPTKIICLENTISGVIHPLDEIKRICAFAREHGIGVHLDGARLWNACSVPSSPSLAEYAREADSVSVCVSKSLGCPVGSFIVGSEKLVAKATHMRKLLGGGIRQAGILTAMAEVGLDEVYLAGRLEESNVYAKQVEAAWVRCGGTVTLPVDTNAVWLDLEGRGVSLEIWQQVGEDIGVKLGGERIMCHFQNSAEAVKRLEDVMKEACRRADTVGLGTERGGEDEVASKSYLRSKH
ncbi:pyridoxal phosphate-dependent transferase [Tricharina praecox]|uniref:pyridoxal phosphate-dependent transferase n=1 Tax=Tricharina praecox TaxID=43433 RepID=UPI00221EEE6D|nr:pyridoxal phosphate-dependent transferase [Tricharina praecox]KAI5857813.1 pyridoxal phosphate-dependent transferase [Tricharina praecox]